jgi:lysophospholipase L1-like esterase
MPRSPSLLLAVACLAVLAAAGAVAIGVATAGPAPAGALPPTAGSSTGQAATSPSPTPPPTRPGSTSTPAGATPDATGSAVARSDLPGAIASIGDSLSVAFDVEPGRFGPAREHSWVVGTDPADGVLSHHERLRALGASGLAVVDAAREGARIADAARQATLVVRGAADLVPGAEVYVTFELGANDICHGGVADMTPPARFAASLRAALAVLRDGTTVDGRSIPGLPAGSRLLVLSVPDVLQLRDLFAGNARARAIYTEFGVCRAALGADRTADELAAVAARLRAYDRILVEACDALAAAAADGADGLDCRHDLGGSPAASLAGATVTADDISTLDYFHPSLLGQARIAEGAWSAGYWSEAEPTP